jgi:hypothetical protein
MQHPCDYRGLLAERDGGAEWISQLLDHMAGRTGAA